MPELREDIKSALQSLISQPLREASLALLATLGYRSDRTLVLEGSKPQAFLDLIESQGGASKFDSVKACFADWKSADILFQLTDEDLAASSSLFKETDIKSGLLRSYLFFAIELKGSDHSRSKLSAIARQINRVFPMPVMVLLKHDRCLSIAVINRRQNKIHADKDVLEKVTLIRDISLIAPHRGHLEILQSIAFAELEHPKKLPIRDFDTLHAAWEQIFNIELLNNRFYKELSNWYFWALPQVDFPDDLEKDAEKRRATGLIRMLTRLIFCWFLKEKDGLIPSKLFDKEELEKILHGFDPESETSSTYYQAILQNLFFATLNQRMGKNDKTKQPYRYFATDDGFQKNRATYDINNLYRYENLFAVSQEEAIALFADIPFLNGGLFECLDRTEDGTNKKLYLDGFSRRKEKRPHVPDRLFFDSGETADLSAAYGDKKRKSEKVTGLISILNRYKFTIVENTPIDQEIALDPELLGKVFENLLASYNEETKTTARKQTGSFYTPRPIVDYMVDESLKAHLSRALVEKAGMKEEDARAGLDILFAYTEKEHAFESPEVATLITAIDEVKILDPACGSGAFPMGVLHKLVYILGKLDEKNERWEQIRIDEAQKISDADERRRRISEIMSNFADNNDDYGRKLYLIENCLYGVDIQPIAIQITKLRFFISLVCDQKTNRNKKDNHGIRPLPNLETKFVAANTLIGLPKLENDLYRDGRVDLIEKEIESLYHSHFSIQRRDQKLNLQKKIKSLRAELADVLAESLSYISSIKSKHLADWDPFDPQSSAAFFDPHWMFGRTLAHGFDIVIGNPPYIRIQNIEEKEAAILKSRYYSAIGKFDIYVLFVENSFNIISKNGIVCFIHPHRFLTADYGRGIKSFLDKVSGLQAAILFGLDQVFEAATTYTGIFSYSHGNSCFQFKHVNSKEFQLLPFTNRAYSKNGSHWNLSTEDASSSELVEKLRSQSRKLSEICVGVFQGIVTVGDDIFVLKGKHSRGIFYGWSKATGKQVELESAIVKPMLKGENIQRFQKPTSEIWVFYPHYQDESGKTRSYSEDQLKNLFPKAYAYVSQFKDALIRKKIQYKTNPKFWFSLHRSREMALFDQPKIITPQLQNYPSFTFDQEQWYPDAGGYSIILKNATKANYMFLLGVLNSSLLWYFIRSTSNPYNNSYYYFKTKYLEPFTLPKEDKVKQVKIGILAEEIHDSKASNKEADTSALERELNQQVYALYGLTPEEIAIVEGTGK